MKHRILFPLLVFTFIGCSKNDSPGTPGPGPNTDSVIASYYSGSTLYIEQLALYTKDGIVTDGTLIQNFLDRNVTNAEAKRLFFVNRTSVDNPGNSLSLEILTKNRARINNEIMEIVQSTDTAITIAKYDLLEVPAVDNSPCGLLLAKVPTFTPRSNCGTSTCTQYRKTFPVLISGSDYYLPILYYAVATSYTEIINDKEVISHCSSVSPEYPMVNRLKEDLIANLSERDTALVQIARLPLLKKSK